MPSKPPPTPTKKEDFSPEWVEAVTQKYLSNFEECDAIKVTRVVNAAKNEVQGILSNTFVVDFEYEIVGKNEDEDAEAKEKSIFVKVPLKDEPQYESVNRREEMLLRDVLPKLKDFLDSKCHGFFKLPMPSLVYCHYDGHGVSDVFVQENLLADDYYNFTGQKCLNVEHMEAVLDSLAYLHGTGLAYRHAEGGRVEDLQRTFPGVETQLQLHDLVEEPELREHFRRHFRAFLHFLEEEEPTLVNHAGYMKKMHRHILKVIEVLETCGYERLITIAHGDAKPNNFMFRRIEIDLDELSCEGIEPILIDWQGGFLGSVANDLMWAMFPFIENRKELWSKAMEYYFDQLTNVLETFSLKPSDLDLPSDFQQFSSLLKKCLILEFLIVTVVKPVLAVSEPAKLLRWHKETIRNKKKRFKKKVVRPDPLEVFSSPRFPGFCSLYFRIATAMGAFQELGGIHFQIMKDAMFVNPNEKMDLHDSDEEMDQDLFSRVVNAPARDLIRGAAGVMLGVGMVAGCYLFVECRVYERYLTKLVVPYCFQG